MSDISMAEISKGVWVPRGLARRPAGGVMNPEDDDERRESAAGGVCWPPVLAPAPAGTDGYYSAHRAATRVAADAVAAEEAKEGVRPLETVAAVTYAETRAHAEKVKAAQAKKEDTIEKVFSNYPSARETYSEADWYYVPDIERPEPFTAAWYNCVKSYRLIKYGEGPLGGGPKLIIEVVLMGETMLRHIIKLSQVKGVLTKSSVRDTHGYMRIEEVIIDLRQNHYGYAPEQVKLRFAGEANALAFQMTLMDAL